MERQKTYHFRSSLDIYKIQFNGRQTFYQHRLTKEDEVRLYRIMDLSLERKLWQRLFGLGTIKCCSADKTLGDFEIKNIKDSKNVKEMISELVEEERSRKRVSSREYISHDMDDDDDDDDVDSDQ